MANNAKEILEQRQKILNEINKSAEEYFKLIKDIGNVERNLVELKKQQVAAINSGKHEYAAQLETMIVSLNETKTMLLSIVKSANESGLAFKLMGKSISNIPGLLKKGFGFIRGSGLFEMEKSIKMAGLEMGILSKQSDSFRKSIINSALGIGKTRKSTIELGIGVQDLAKIQAGYSDEVGRSIQLSDEGYQSMSELAKGTILGSEGAAKMAADMNVVGKSASSTRDFVEQTMTDAHKMGLNASKVIKNIQSNFGLINKYNFKNGTKGLAAMAEHVTKMGVSMDLVTGMAEKLFDIEGAVEMSAQLQVLGGEWSKLADPFKLMYMARNDLNGLTESIINATKGSAQFNKESGEFDISALKMQELRKVAEAAGLNYEELAVAAKNAAKFTEIDSQMRINVDDDTKKFIESTAEFNKDKKAVISIDGVDRLVSSLNSSDIAQLKAQALQKANLREMAKNSQNFDEALNNTFTLMKTALLPIIKEINEKLIPLVKDFFEDKGGFKSSLIEWGKKAADFIGGIANFVTKIGSFITEFPKISAGLYLLFEGGKWVANGMALGAGFNIVTGGQGSGILQSALGFGKMAGIAFAGAAGTILGTSIGKYIGSSISNLFGNKSSKTGDILSLVGGGVGGLAGGAAWGGAIGTVLAPFTGGLSIPLGMALGAGAGALIGSTVGKVGGDFIGDGINDGIIGKDFSKGRGIIQGGKVTPIDNEDDLLAMKPKGVVNNVLNNTLPQEIKIEFGELKFKFDELKILSPGNPSVAVDLINNPEFIRNMTKMIHIETTKAINGGKLMPHPIGK